MAVLVFSTGIRRFYVYLILVRLKQYWGVGKVLLRSYAV